MMEASTVSGEGAQFFAYQGIAPYLDGIPTALAAVDQWVLYKTEPKPKGGMNKIPYQPTGRKASSTDPSTWSDFGTVWSAYEESTEEYAGVGFVVTKRDDFIGGDLDHCRNAETGELTPLAARIVKGIPTYWEVTPSGTGIRFFARGELASSFKGNGLEVYSADRFLTATGERLTENDEPEYISPGALARLRELATGRRGNGAR